MNVQPMRRRERFDFDAFDQLIGSVLDETVQVDNVVDLNANVVELRPDLPDIPA